MDIQLNGPDAEDKIRLDFAQLEIRRLANSSNTVKALHIEFGEKTKYWTLVRALDLCRIENVRTYVSDQDDIWIFNISPTHRRIADSLPHFFCGTGLARYMSKNPNQLQQESQEKIDFWIKKAKNFWLSGVLLVSLVGISVIRLRATRIPHLRHY
jgi:hypothetical protein